MRWLLLTKIESTDAHQGLTAAVGVIVCASVYFACKAWGVL